MTKKATTTIETLPPAASAPSPPNWKLVSRTQLAELMGVHPDSITDWSGKGMPVVTRGGHGKESAYDAVDCLAWQRQQMGKNAKDNAQTRAYTSTAKLNELKLEREMGELVPRDQVVLEGLAFVKAWSARVRAIPRKLVQAGVIPRDREHAAAKLMVDILQDISGWKNLGVLKRAAKDTHAA